MGKISVRSEHRGKSKWAPLEAREKRQAIFDQNREKYEAELEHCAEVESNLKLHYKDAQSEVKDLRNRIDELREYSDKVDDENRRLRKELEETKPKTAAIKEEPADLDASSLVEQYERYIRDLKDKIDEQNTTINSLREEPEIHSTPSRLSSRVDPDGEEESSGDILDSDNEDSYEKALQFHLTSTPGKMDKSFAEELKGNAMTPRTLNLLNDQTENLDSWVQVQVETSEVALQAAPKTTNSSTETIVKKYTSTETQVLIKTEEEMRQNEMLLELEDRLHCALKDAENIGALAHEKDNALDELRISVETCTQLERELDKYRLELDETRQKTFKILAEKTALEQKQNIEEVKVKNVQNQMENVEKKVSKLTEELVRTREEKENAEKMLKNIELDGKIMEKLKNDLSEAQENYFSEAMKAKTLTEEAKKSESKIAELESLVSLGYAEKDRLSGEIRALALKANQKETTETKEVAELKSQIASLQEMNETFHKNVTSTSEKLMLEKQECTKLRGQIAQLNKTNKENYDLKSTIAKMKTEHEVTKKTLKDKETLVEALNKKGRNKNELTKKQTQQLRQTVSELKMELEALKDISASNEQSMKNELDNMEKQLHLAIEQTVELEDKLQKIISEKSNLLSEKERENAKKSAELSQLNEQLAKISELEKSHQLILKEEKVKMKEALDEKARQLSTIEEKYTRQINELNFEKEILQENLEVSQQDVEDLEEKLKKSKEIKPTITTVITETTEIIKSKPKINNGTYLKVEFEKDSSESESDESADQSIIIELQKENQELREQIRNLEKIQETNDRLRLTSSDTPDCDDSNSVSSSIIAYSPSMNQLRLVDSNRLSTSSTNNTTTQHKSTLFKVAEMRAQLGLPPIADQQVATLENENIELTSKLRKTRIMLNDNTNRLRDMYRKLNKSEVLIQNLYMENSRLMRAMKASFSPCASPEEQGSVI
ncbi:Oidioi.mRNA.OKI2018_I69.chr2.g7584.t2.cds [Oikopleura dioica]|uniref:Oidioi.mRNA.OKI2018_I69.chr2.g7584.t2.cds n=1 Tax=Oikopleura dioica TaxID=34765 RepID=A0ABN7T747_OIKDI|nr:Oidioi.mRNA.OKI2018_I69.chr2.g7584.t2.cds [Oikopleura dioica]